MNKEGASKLKKRLIFSNGTYIGFVFSHAQERVFRQTGFFNWFYFWTSIVLRRSQSRAGIRGGGVFLHKNLLSGADRTTHKKNDEQKICLAVWFARTMYTAQRTRTRPMIYGCRPSPCGTFCPVSVSERHVLCCRAPHLHRMSLSFDFQVGFGEE